MDRDELMNTATRLGRHVGIIETARAVIERGIDPRSERMVDLTRAAFPAANQREAEAAAELAAIVWYEEEVMNEFVKKGLLVRTGDIKRGWAVFTRHPRIDILRETNGWTFEEAWDFAMRNPIQ
jgi:hypothetical protein